MSDSPLLAKHKAILEILSGRPELKKKYYQFGKCLYHIPYFISLIYAKDNHVSTSGLRCPLKNRCPKCMDEDHIREARKKDYAVMSRTAKSIGANRFWLLRWESSDRAGMGKKFSQAMSRSDSRHTPAMTGTWGGEMICAPFRAIIKSSNGLKQRATFVFNALVFASEDSELDPALLEKQFPGILVYSQVNLELTWGTYLQWWSITQISLPEPEEIIAWMTGKGRMFEALGELRGAKSAEAKERIEKTHNAMGKSAMLGFFDRLSSADEVIAKIAYNLPESASKLLGHKLTAKEQEEIMGRIKPQIIDVLSPSISDEDLTKELLALKERVKAIERVIGEDAYKPLKGNDRWKM